MPLGSNQYTVLSGPEDFPPHPEFIVRTQPIEHDLCGPLNYFSFDLDFDGGLDPIDSPLTYAEAEPLVWTAETEDETLIGTTEPYFVNAEF